MGLDNCGVQFVPVASCPRRLSSQPSQQGTFCLPPYLPKGKVKMSWGQREQIYETRLIKSELDTAFVDFLVILFNDNNTVQ